MMEEEVDLYDLNSTQEKPRNGMVNPLDEAFTQETTESSRVTTTDLYKDEYGDDKYDDVVDYEDSTDVYQNSLPVHQGDMSVDSNVASNGLPYIPAEVANPNGFMALYVGNMSWWTSEDDLRSACRKNGVHDIIYVHFFDNKINGKSKGYACISFGSPSSAAQMVHFFSSLPFFGRQLISSLTSHIEFSSFIRSIREAGASSARVHPFFLPPEVQNIVSNRPAGRSTPIEGSSSFGFQNRSYPPRGRPYHPRGGYHNRPYPSYSDSKNDRNSFSERQQKESYYADRQAMTEPDFKRHDERREDRRDDRREDYRDDRRVEKREDFRDFKRDERREERRDDKRDIKREEKKDDKRIEKRNVVVEERRDAKNIARDVQSAKNPEPDDLRFSIGKTEDKSKQRYDKSPERDFHRQRERDSDRDRGRNFPRKR